MQGRPIGVSSRSSGVYIPALRGGIRFPGRYRQRRGQWVLFCFSYFVVEVKERDGRVVVCCFIHLLHSMWVQRRFIRPPDRNKR